jgi:hypothetical protein
MPGLDGCGGIILERHARIVFVTYDGRDTQRALLGVLATSSSRRGEELLTAVPRRPGGALVRKTSSA